MPDPGTNAVRSDDPPPNPASPALARPRRGWGNWALLVGLVGVLLFMQWRGEFAPVPPVFEEQITLQQGLDRAAKADRLVLVYASASWCGPCQTYKRTTLVDSTVVHWIRRYTEPVYLNIDRDQTTAERLGVSSIPVTILLKDGKEIARLTGAASADEFMRWVQPWTDPAPQH
jgi:thiol:disulfide interchange protein